MQKTTKNEIHFPKLDIKKIPPKVILALVCLIILLVSVGIGAVSGISAAQVEIEKYKEIAITTSLGEQYILAQEDIAAGRFDIAQQRLVYILDEDPNFPGVAEKLVEVITEMNISGETITIITEPTPVSYTHL